jgi:hypothetical protein
MSDIPERAWDALQKAWRAEGPASRSPPRDTLRRAVQRHRRLSWIYSASDVVSAIVFCGAGVYALTRSHALPTLVWTANIFLFTFALLGFTVYNRRDALFASTRPTTDFLAWMRVRLRRRERVPRFVAAFAAAETIAGLVFYAVFYPGMLLRSAAVYATLAAVIGAGCIGHARRLRRERAQLDALGRELDVT